MLVKLCLYVSRSITISEIKEEYCSRFLDGSIGTVTWEAAQGKQSKLADEDSSDEGPLGPESSSNAEIVPLDVSQEDINDLGYMPERDDFEKVIFLNVLF